MSRPLSQVFPCLYVKIHKITGLKYFGKTIQNPFKYKGSGIYWNNHLKIHGNDVITIILGYFNERNIKDEALKFSKENNIVISKEWANLVEENGEGGVSGYKHTEEWKMENSKRHIGNKYNLGKKQTKEQVENRIKKCKGQKRSEEFCKMMSELMRGNTNGKYTKGNINRAKNYRIYFIDGSMKEIYCLKRYAKENNIQYDIIKKTSSGIRNSRKYGIIRVEKVI